MLVLLCLLIAIAVSVWWIHARTVQVNQEHRQRLQRFADSVQKGDPNAIAKSTELTKRIKKSE